jgi:hypothetical protein
VLVVPKVATADECMLNVKLRPFLLPVSRGYMLVH